MAVEWTKGPSKELKGIHSSCSQVMMQVPRGTWIAGLCLGDIQTKKLNAPQERLNLPRKFTLSAPRHLRNRSDLLYGGIARRYDAIAICGQTFVNKVQGVDKMVMKAIGIAIAMGTLAFSTAALAGGDCAPGQNKGLLQAGYAGTGSPTPGGVIKNLGGAISGGFYGNTSNSGASPYAPANGHGVTPSISPGPQTTVPPQGPGSGASVGDAIQACRDLP